MICWGCLCTAALPIGIPPARAQDAIAQQGPPRRAVIIPLHEEITPLSGALLQRKFADAVASDAAVIILDIHSPGGWTAVTFELMDMVLDAKDVETVAFIEKDAISGAALLSLACDTIIMLPTARIGDAGEIVMGSDGAFRYTEAKSRSVLAQKVRDTAAATGRPLALAEKMVDKDMVVFEAQHRTDGTTRYFSDKEWDSFKEADQWQRGKPIREAQQDTFFIANGERAATLGIANQTIANRQQLATALNISEPIRVMERTWIDTFVFVLNYWPVTVLLIIIGLVALVIELGAPGLGVGGLVSLLCFSLFFWSRFLGGTAGWLEVILFVVGLSFIAAEILVIPGFGVAGVAGMGLTITSLVMASRRVLVPHNAEELSGLGMDVLTVVGAFIGFLVVVVALSQYIGEIPGLSRLTLKPPMAVEGGMTIPPGPAELLPGWQRVEIGDVGAAVSPLRPSGKVQVGDLMVDVVTEGDFVESGREVRVIAKQGAKVVVRPV